MAFLSLGTSPNGYCTGGHLSYGYTDIHQDPYAGQDGARGGSSAPGGLTSSSGYGLDPSCLAPLPGGQQALVTNMWNDVEPTATSATPRAAQAPVATSDGGGWSLGGLMASAGFGFDSRQEQQHQSHSALRAPVDLSSMGITSQPNINSPQQSQTGAHFGSALFE
eukprot:CAMPEP_0178461972 /NCGR_PEP_ID=MMETSP0689_2-20121128/49588_1 /TAXON_ID=160604 /ORGANISM="Amphidinium massartii, Strain CS-259" /LENGTH=164 /DNA_ID=CAMNT_0020088831 /DNA_START=147 /DNA_END=638 /DNA_ORIENTATION=-